MAKQQSPTELTETELEEAKGGLMKRIDQSTPILQDVNDAADSEPAPTMKWVDKSSPI